MKNTVQLFLLLISSFYFSQQDTNWYTFYNSDSTKIGYKDAKAIVRIEPKFELAMTNSKVFKDVSYRIHRSQRVVPESQRSNLVSWNIISV